MLGQRASTILRHLHTAQLLPEGLDQVTLIAAYGKSLFLCTLSAFVQQQIAAFLLYLDCSRYGEAINVNKTGFTLKKRETDNKQEKLNIWFINRKS